MILGGVAAVDRVLLFGLTLVSVVVGTGLGAESKQPSDGAVSQPVKRASTKAVKCYQCNSDNSGEEDCVGGEPSTLKKYIKECPVLQEGDFAGKAPNSCRKVIQHVVDESSVVRECSYSGDEEVDGKRRTGNKGVILHLYQCFNADEELPCNSASFTSATILHLITAILSFLLCLKLTA